MAMIGVIIGSGFTVLVTGTQVVHTFICHGVQ